MCSRAFASLFAVKIHLKVHQSLDTHLKFVCNICNAQYGRSYALSDHLKTAHPGMENGEAVEVEVEEHYIIEESEVPNGIEEKEVEVYSVAV